MIQREDFPYLQSFVINDAYAVQNLTVPVFEGGEFKHLILTGKNGSGKTTVLRGLYDVIQRDTSQVPTAFLDFDSNPLRYSIINSNYIL